MNSKHKHPTAQQARELLGYDPETGILRWKPRPLSSFPNVRIAKSWNAKHAGKVAGSVTASTARYKRKQVWLKTKAYYAHRVAWLITHGEWPAGQIDHINGDATDNRIANLRVVDHTTNMRNTRLPKGNTSGVIGVSWRKDTNKWGARIQVNGKYRSLGYFTDFDDAVAARKAAEVVHGYHPNHGRIA
jgi:hypothetical protein